MNGASRDRTGDLLLAKQALSQLSYGLGEPSVALRRAARRRRHWAARDGMHDRRPCGAPRRRVRPAHLLRRAHPQRPCPPVASAVLRAARSPTERRASRDARSVSVLKPSLLSCGGTLWTRYKRRPDAARRSRAALAPRAADRPSRAPRPHRKRAHGRLRSRTCNWLAGPSPRPARSRPRRSRSADEIRTSAPAAEPVAGSRWPRRVHSLVDYAIANPVTAYAVLQKDPLSPSPATGAVWTQISRWWNGYSVDFSGVEAPTLSISAIQGRHPASPRMRLSRSVSEPTPTGGRSPSPRRSGGWPHFDGSAERESDYLSGCQSLLLSRPQRRCACRDEEVLQHTPMTRCGLPHTQTHLCRFVSCERP